MEKLLAIAPNAAEALAFSATYSALLVLLGIALAVRVIGVRRSERIGIGDGGSKELARRIRCHGNYSEYAPLLIGLLILLPLLGAKAWLVHLVGLMGLVGRVAHAYGLSQSAGTTFGRLGGMILTFTALGIGAIALLVLAWA